MATGRLFEKGICLLLNNIDQLIFQCEHLVQVRPWIADDITGLNSSWLHIDAVGE